VTAREVVISSPPAEQPPAHGSWRRLAGRWVDFWDRREAPTSLALVRIAFAGVVLSDLLIGKLQGALPAFWLPPPLGMGQTPDPASWWATPTEPAVLFALGVVSTFLLMVGALHRLAGATLTFVLVMFPKFQPVGDGLDVLLRTVVPILALSNASACWSVDAWLRRRRGLVAVERIAAWPRYLLMLQLIWVYASSAQCRDDGSWWPWGGFSAIGHVLEDPHFARFFPGMLTSFYPVTVVATMATMVFELSAPLMLLFLLRDRGRWPDSSRLIGKLPWIWIALGATLHVGIAVTMTIGIFPFAMLALYPVFLHPEQLVTLMGRLAAQPRRSAIFR
jgi:hypothetical protein